MTKTDKTVLISNLEQLCIERNEKKLCMGPIDTCIKCPIHKVLEMIFDET